MALSKATNYQVSIAPAQSIPPTTHTQLATYNPHGNQAQGTKKHDPVALVVIGAIVLGCVASAAGVIPNVATQMKANQAIAERQIQNGITEISQGEAEALLPLALPLLDGNGQWSMRSWEDIKNDKSIPNGVYLTPNSVVEKKMVGSGAGAVLGHKVGVIAPELAMKRFREYMDSRNPRKTKSWF